MPSDPCSPARDSIAQRGQTLIARYARESDEHGARTSEHVSAAGDLIADVLAYIATLPDTDVPAVYRTGHARRFAQIAARGVWSALATDTGDARDPAAADLEEASVAFEEFLRLA
jgi:hypothetical protein